MISCLQYHYNRSRKTNVLLYSYKNNATLRLWTYLLRMLMMHIAVTGVWIITATKLAGSYYYYLVDHYCHTKKHSSSY